MRHWPSACLIAILGLTTVGCQFPRDPEGTLERVRGDTLRVGVLADPPWVDLSKAPPTGVEADLVRELARSIDGDVEWVEAPESELFDALRGFQLGSSGSRAPRAWPTRISRSREALSSDAGFSTRP
jgi:polar amino acid transport system substrate-binding protein